jgi:rare lipoprotein A
MRDQFKCVLIVMSITVGVVGCGTATPRFTTSERSIASDGHQLEGIASYYAEEFNGRRTANGEVYDMHGMTAAHRTLPFNTKVRIRNLDNQREVVVRINDRGPFKGDRVIDLSLEAAKQLGLMEHGTAAVSLNIVELGP